MNKQDDEMNVPKPMDLNDLDEKRLSQLNTNLMGQMYFEQWMKDVITVEFMKWQGSH